MMFNAPTVDGLVDGRVHCTFRRWNAARARVGSRFTTRGVVIEVTSVERVLESELTDADAVEAGFDSLQGAAALDQRQGQRRRLYRIGIALAGPDPRIALRASDQLTDTEIAALTAKLDRMDRAADEPWTWRTLRRSATDPGVVSTELAAEVGQDRAYFKLRVRRLKALGLTESLEIGYLLSPRGVRPCSRWPSESGRRRRSRASTRFYVTKCVHRFTSRGLESTTSCAVRVEESACRTPCRSIRSGLRRP